MAPLTNRELAKQLRDIADIGIVHHSQTDILRTAADRLERKGHKMTKDKALVFYSVWDNRTDELIALDLPEKETLIQLRSYGPDGKRRRLNVRMTDRNDVPLYFTIQSGK